MEKTQVFTLILLQAIIFNGGVLAGSSCSHYGDCYNCVSRDCNWCPLDEVCHSKISLFSNQCNPTQSINATKDCRNQLYKSYDPSFAYETVLLTAVADTNQSEQCLKKLFPHRDYQIIEVISEPCDSFWFKYQHCNAYVGLSLSNKTIVVAYRGTKQDVQLVEEMLVTLAIPKQKFVAGGHVQAYFLNAHMKLYTNVAKNVKSLKSKYPDYNVLVVGHSLGGAMASIAAASLVYENIVKSDQLILYTFGMPRVGDQDYAYVHDKLVPSSYRLVHHRDIVPHLPLCKISCSVHGPYQHGREVFYPDVAMTTSSRFTVCRGDEDKSCSDGFITKHPCLMDMSTCWDDHRNYFGIEVSHYCDRILLP